MGTPKVNFSYLKFSSKVIPDAKHILNFLSLIVRYFSLPEVCYNNNLL